jgi:hypothetical protein
MKVNFKLTVYKIICVFIENMRFQVTVIMTLKTIACRQLIFTLNGMMYMTVFSSFYLDR